MLVKKCMEIEVLRIGQRVVRDDRVTTHVALVARSFGAKKIYMNEINPDIINTISKINKTWGGPFEIKTITDKSNGLIKLTFGSFNKPVTKYILVKDGKLSYYQGLPLPTSANYKAHNLIKEVIFDIS